MSEDGITLSRDQVDAIYRALAAMDRELASMRQSVVGQNRTFLLFAGNVQAIRMALMPKLLHITN